VEEIATAAEGLRIEEWGPFPSEVSTRAFQARFHDEYIASEGHELPFFREDLPVLREGETLREGSRLFRKESLLDDFAFVQEEGPKPCREEQHAGAKGMIP
jgi:hypothetical protein